MVFLSQQPFIVLFLIVALGLWVARANVRGVSLGVVASTLFVGLLFSVTAFKVYDVSFKLPDFTKEIFFNFFIYAVGLKVGPQCFAGLEKNGKQFLIITLVVLILSPLFAIGCARYFGFHAGDLTGMLAGANTASASFGAAQSALVSEPIHGDTEAIGRDLAVSFALAYALSMALFVVTIGYFPLLTRSNAKADASKMDQELQGDKQPLPSTVGALDVGSLPVDIRAYRVKSPALVGQSVVDLRRRNPRAVIEAVRREGQLLPVRDDLVLALDDEIAIGGRISSLIEAPEKVGPEVDVEELRGVQIETADVVLSRREYSGRPLEEVRVGVAHGLYVNAIFRMGNQIPVSLQTLLKRGDVIRASGAKRDLDRFAKAAGGIVRPSLDTDLLTLSLGLALGVALGAISVRIAGLGLKLGAAAALLIVSIIWSWLRTRYPKWGGPFPEPARRFIENIGLSVFMAILAINTGPGAYKAIQGGIVGPVLISTVIVGFLPITIAWFIGIHALKLNSALLLGAVCGARQDAAGLKVVQERFKSSVPAIAFALPYTVSTLVFTVYGYLTLVLWR